LRHRSPLGHDRGRDQGGRIEIPRELPDQLGLQPENVLELQNQAGTLVASKKVEPDGCGTRVTQLKPKILNHEDGPFRFGFCHRVWRLQRMS
jgi:hypothetical protein